MERDGKIDPALKEWIDKVLVPVMLREYLEARSIVGDNVPRPNSSEESNSPETERLQ